MADTHETIVDIIAEMRNEGHTGESSCLEWVGTKMLYYADRLEAAHKREVGDAAKLREALTTIRKRLVAAYESEACFMRYSPNKPLVDLIDAALAAPPRNCDKFSHDEALQVWASEKGNEHNGCFDEWLYEIAKDGGVK